MSNPDLEKLIFEEQNKVRVDPQSYIEKLKESMQYFKGEILHKPNEDAIKTFEGISAYEEAVEFLSRQNPVNELLLDERLSQACRDHVVDCGPKGTVSHEGSDGKNCSDRIEKYCEWDGACAESIEFGSKTAQEIIINLIVDDGVPERFQRKNLFNPDFKYVGVGSGSHRDFGTMSVINYVAGVHNHGEESPDAKDFVKEHIGKMHEKKVRPKNAFQDDDPDAPDNTVSVKIVKTTKVIKGKPRKITRKIYTLDNNTQHIVEIEDLA